MLYRRAVSDEQLFTVAGATASPARRTSLTGEGLLERQHLQDISTALAELREWAPSLTDETLGPPRLVLVAEGFGPVLTNTAMYLIEQGIDLRLMRVQLYALEADQLARTCSQLLPVPDAEDFMVRPRSSAPTQRATRPSSRRTHVERLIDAQALEAGQVVTIVVPANVKQSREAVASWLNSDPARSQSALDGGFVRAGGVGAGRQVLGLVGPHPPHRPRGHVGSADRSAMGPGLVRRRRQDPPPAVNSSQSSEGCIRLGGPPQPARGPPRGSMDDVWRPCRSHRHGRPAAGRPHGPVPELPPCVASPREQRESRARTSRGATRPTCEPKKPLSSTRA